MKRWGQDPRQIEKDGTKKDDGASARQIIFGFGCGFAQKGTQTGDLVVGKREDERLGFSVLFCVKACGKHRCEKREDIKNSGGERRLFVEG